MAKRIGCFCAILSQICLFAQGASATRNDTDHIVERLRAADTVAHQGDLIYDRREYRDGVHPSSTTAIHLQYENSRRYREEQSKGNEPIALIQINDGQSQFIVHPRQATVAITDDSIGMAPIHLGLGPQANFVLGRGLSTLQNLRVSRSGRDIVVKGLLDGGAPITALVDAQHGYIATSITWDGVATWTYGKPIRTKDGYWLPSSMTYETGPSSGPVTYRFRYDFRSGGFTRPAASVFRVNLRDFRQIDDNRVPNSPTFFKVPPPGIPTEAYTLPVSVKTAADLLPFSIQQAEMEAKTRGKQPMVTANRRVFTIGLSVAFLASLLLAAWLTWKRNKALASG